ncbi:MAG: CPBP family intramembrane metalloprotease [Candidatus Aminicenantes bacterium]|nr:CPBP family intramembrane metalloprotease [Candidatus Aminicenantes bacterium]
MPGLKEVIQRYPLSAYVLLCYLFSWAFLIPCYRILLNAEEGTFPWLALIGLPGAYGPSLVAILMVKLTEEKGRVKELLKKLLFWKAAWRWYLLILLVPVLLETAAVLISQTFSYSLGTLTLKRALTVYFPYVLIALPFGPMGEELGWRGYLLPKLLEKHTPLAASVILGFIWTFWHMASFSFPGAAIPSLFDVTSFTILLYLATIFGETLLLTFIYFKSGGSVLLAILFHAVFNASSNIVFSLFQDVSQNVAHREVIYIINFALMILLGTVLLVSLQKKSARQKLPYT